MFNTGNSFSDYFLLGVNFLPLFPVLLIIVRRFYGQEPFNFLAVICLLCFLRGFTDLAHSRTRETRDPTHEVLTLLLFVFFVLAFRSNLGGKLRYGLNLFLTALFSILVTFWSQKGWDGGSPMTGMVLNGFLAVLICLSLPIVIRTDELGVFHSPLFWMESGTLFYICLSLLLEGLGICCRPLADPLDPEKRLLLGLADMIRYLAYIAAVLSP
jgi:hypothetical protein